MSEPLICALHHVAIQTGHFEESLAFYVEVLGLRLLERRQFKRRQLAWLQAGSTKIELFSNREGEALALWSDFYCGPVHLAFEVANLDDFLALAQKRGARFHPSHPEPFVPPVPNEPRIAFLLGPDGEEVEIRGPV